MHANWWSSLQNARTAKCECLHSNNVCIQTLRRISRKMIPRQIKRKRSMADHKNPLVRSSWAENSEAYGRVGSSVGWRSVEQSLALPARRGMVTTAFGCVCVCVPVSVSWLAYWNVASLIALWQTWLVHVQLRTPHIELPGQIVWYHVGQKDAVISWAADLRSVFAVQSNLHDESSYLVNGSSRFYLWHKW